MARIPKRIASLLRSFFRIIPAKYNSLSFTHFHLIIFFDMIISHKMQHSMHSEESQFFKKCITILFCLISGPVYGYIYVAKSYVSFFTFLNSYSATVLTYSFTFPSL